MSSITTTLLLHELEPMATYSTSPVTGTSGIREGVLGRWLVSEEIKIDENICQINIMEKTRPVQKRY